jgi:glycosyltransferase involved in cell wall biosynthesis
MKISIVIQYYNRRYQLYNTISSINQSSIKKQAEIIIIDDASSDEHTIDDFPSMFPDLDFKIFSFTSAEKWWSCPVVPANKGISMATGDVVILLSGECMFIGDILLDVQQRIKPNDYLVYATLSLTSEYTSTLLNRTYDDILTNRFDVIASPGYTGGWYQHSKYRNTCFNFCTAIMRDDILDLGGFDERFGWGVSHADDNFLDRIKLKGMNIISIDEPMTYHQWHPPMQTHPDSDNLKDNDLLIVTRSEPGYKVTNSFIK